MTAAEFTGTAPDDGPAEQLATTGDGEPGGSSEAVIDASWLRLSPRSLVVRPLTDLARLLPLLAGLIILRTHTGSGVLWGIGSSAVAVVSGVVRWITTRYKITPDRIYVRRGLFNQ